jgi:hypothetical protein
VERGLNALPLGQDRRPDLGQSRSQAPSHRRIGTLAEDLTPGPPEERGIAKLRRWLYTAGYADVDREIGFLQGLQAVRSKGVAHRKGSDYEKVLKRAVGDRRGAAAATKLLEDALTLVQRLRLFAESQAKPATSTQGTTP